MLSYQHFIYSSHGVLLSPYFLMETEGQKVAVYTQGYEGYAAELGL